MIVGTKEPAAPTLPKDAKFQEKPSDEAFSGTSETGRWKWKDYGLSRGTYLDAPKNAWVCSLPATE